MVETILKMKYNKEYNAFNIKNIYIRYKYCLNSLLKPIAVALDLMQRDSCTIDDSVVIWKNLQKEITPKLSQDAKKKLSKRIEQAMTQLISWLILLTLNTDVKI